MKIFTAFIFLVSSLLAVEGVKVFEDNCKVCHSDSTSRADFIKHSKDMLAPPMIGVSQRLKSTIVINTQNTNDEEIHRFAVISYIKEYLKKPSWDYYTCSDRAVNRFDVMPAQSHLSEEELQAVAEWIYDYFEDKEFK